MFGDFIDTYLVDISDRDCSKNPCKDVSQNWKLSEPNHPLSACTTSSKALTVAIQLSLALQHGSSLSLTVALHTLLLTAEMIDVKEFGHHEWNSNSCPSKLHVYASNYGD